MKGDNMYSIYKIINKTNGKYYIGQTMDLKKRKNRHYSTLRKNNHHNRYLQRAFNKYGESNFDFVVIYSCLSKEDADLLEVKLIEENYDNNILYNISKKVGGGDIISYHPENQEIRKKIGVSSKLNWKNKSEEEKMKYKERVSGENSHRYGKPHTKEARIKISKALKGRKFSEEDKKLMSIRQIKRFQREEERQKARDNMNKRYKDVRQRELTGKKNLHYNNKNRQSGIFKEYEFKDIDNYYEFIFNGKYYMGIKSCADDTGYHGGYIKKKLLSFKEIDIFNYLIYDPQTDIKIDNGKITGVYEHSKETKNKIRESNLKNYEADISVHMPNGDILKFKNNFEVIEFLESLGMKASTVSMLIGSGEEWNPKKYIHRHLKGLKIIKIK